MVVFALFAIELSPLGLMAWLQEGSTRGGRHRNQWYAHDGCDGEESAALQALPGLDNAPRLGSSKVGRQRELRNLRQ